MSQVGWLVRWQTVYCCYGPSADVGIQVESPDHSPSDVLELCSGDEDDYHDADGGGSSAFETNLVCFPHTGSFLILFCITFD